MSVYPYRRGTVFWALILIAVGVIFLWSNFNPAIRPWQIVAKFWPIIIIFWGLSKLIDYLQARAHPETTPPPLFSAGEIIVLILVLLLGTLVSKIVLRQWPAGLGIGDEDFARMFLNSYSYTQTISQEVGAQPRLLLVNRRGNIEIQGADQPKLEVVVKKTVWAADEKAAAAVAEQTKIQVVEQAGRYLLEAGSEASSGTSVQLDFVVRVPRATSTEVTTSRGEIALEGLQGEQTITSRRGLVRLTGLEGLVRVNKGGGRTEARDLKGSLEINGRGQDMQVANVAGNVIINGDFMGEMEFRSISQSLRYNSSRTNLNVQKLTGQLMLEMGDLEANGIEGPFEVTTRQKDIRLRDFRHRVRIVNTNGDIVLATSVAPTQPIDVQLRKGDIELIIPKNSNFQIEAQSRQGKVECDFAGPNLQVSKDGDRPSIAGSFGKGGPMIRLTTAYGTLRLGHEGLGRAAPPAPPTPPAPPKSPSPPSSPAPSAEPVDEDKQAALRSDSALRINDGVSYLAGADEEEALAETVGRWCPEQIRLLKASDWPAKIADGLSESCARVQYWSK